MTNLPVQYDWPDVQNIRDAIKQDPPMTEEEALRKAGITRLDVIVTARPKNQQKGCLLMVALALEVLAVGAVATGVTIVII